MALRNSTYTIDDLIRGNLHNRDLRELDILVDKYGEDDPHVRDFIENLMGRNYSTPESVLDHWLI